MMRVWRWLRAAVNGYKRATAQTDEDWAQRMSAGGW